MEDHNLLHRYYEAISENNLTELREILLISPNILQHQVYDVPPLLIAVENNWVGMLRLFLEYGLSLDDADGTSPLFSGISRGSYECVELLLQNGVNQKPTTKEHYHILYSSITKEENRMSELLLHYGLDLWSSQREKDSMFFVNVVSDDIFGVKVLLYLGANVNIRGVTGQTPLSYTQSPEMTMLLLGQGANVLSLDNKKKTVLKNTIEVLRNLDNETSKGSYASSAEYIFASVNIERKHSLLSIQYHQTLDYVLYSEGLNPHILQLFENHAIFSKFREIFWKDLLIKKKLRWKEVTESKCNLKAKILKDEMTYLIPKLNELHLESHSCYPVRIPEKVVCRFEGFDEYKKHLTEGFLDPFIKLYHNYNNMLNKQKNQKINPQKPCEELNEKVRKLLTFVHVVESLIDHF